jgi:hypothetical protein
MSAWADGPSPASTTTKAAASAAKSPVAADDKRRFVWHNGQWWYYKPNGKWLVHDGTAWHVPPAAVTTTRAYQPATRYRSSSDPRSRQFMGSGRNGSGMADDGLWGNSPRYWTYQHVIKSQ